MQNTSFPLAWWEAFWLTREDPFGAPSETLMSLIVGEIGRRKHAPTAVDIASGNGRYAIPLARLGCIVDAIEWTSSGIEAIHKSATMQGLQINCIQANFLDECNTARQYDIIVCSGLLEEIDKEHQSNALRGMAGWLSQDGIAIIKYCLEIEGRGQLVEDNLVTSILLQSGLNIEKHIENKVGKSHAATAMDIRTGTVAARRVS